MRRHEREEMEGDVMRRGGGEGSPLFLCNLERELRAC